MTDGVEGVAEPLPEGRLEGREAFVGLIRQGLASAAREGWSPLVLSDADFAANPDRRYAAHHLVASGRCPCLRWRGG